MRLAALSVARAEIAEGLVVVLLRGLVELLHHREVQEPVDAGFSNVCLARATSVA